MDLDVALRLPQEAETVALIRTAVTNTLTLFGVGDQCVEDIRLAVSEACTNVIEHAAVDDDYEVRVQVDDERCVISVKNAGDAFDAKSLVGEMPDSRSARGRGVAIIRALVDHFDFTSSRESGTIVNLTKKLTVREGGPIDRLRRRAAVPQR